jgi:hypothetical protein
MVHSSFQRLDEHMMSYSSLPEGKKELYGIRRMPDNKPKLFGRHMLRRESAVVLLSSA